MVRQSQTPEREIELAVAAAVRGIERVIARHHLTGWRITLEDVKFMYTDLSVRTIGAYECAGAIATFKAFFPDEPEPETYYEDGWRVRV
jgi:hypothetical protein